jgi:hypothetical protein
MRSFVRVLIPVVAITVAGCSAYEPVSAPPPRTTQPRVAPPPQPVPQARPQTAPPQDAALRSPRDDEGLGNGPLGRAGVLLDRAIYTAEQLKRAGNPPDPSLIAHLRMTRQARDLIATGDTERAADLLERAIAIDDGAGFGYAYLGYIHLTAGNTEQAGIFLERAYSLLPADPALRVEIGALRERARTASVPLASAPR